MTERVKLIPDAYKSRKSARARLNQLLEEIAEVLSPERCGFTNSDSYTRRQTRIYDTTPVIAKRGLVNAISVYVKHVLFTEKIISFFRE